MAGAHRAGRPGLPPVPRTSTVVAVAVVVLVWALGVPGAAWSDLATAGEATRATTGAACTARPAVPIPAAGYGRVTAIGCGAPVHLTADDLNDALGTLDWSQYGAHVRRPPAVLRVPAVACSARPGPALTVVGAQVVQLLDISGAEVVETVLAFGSAAEARAVYEGRVARAGCAPEQVDGDAADPAVMGGEAAVDAARPSRVLPGMTRVGGGPGWTLLAPPLPDGPRLGNVVVATSGPYYVELTLAPRWSDGRGLRADGRAVVGRVLGRLSAA